MGKKSCFAATRQKMIVQSEDLPESGANKVPVDLVWLLHIYRLLLMAED